MNAPALRAEAALIDAAAEKNLAWAVEVYGRGLTELGKLIDARIKAQTKRASILREDAAWIESRWPEEIEAQLWTEKMENRP